MRIAFLSTMAGDPWGGSEELWVQTAELALQKGHTVIASVYDWGKLPPKIENLRKAGAIIHLRKRIQYNDSVRNKIKGKLRELTTGYAHLKSILKHKPEVLVLSQGTVNEVGNPNGIRFLKELQIPYFIINQLNTEFNTIGFNQMKEMREIFKKAATVFFVSARNLETAQRQFCYKFSNGAVIHNPVNLPAREALPWPENNKLQFATVARLDNTVKGQGVLLQILSSETWKSRNWELKFWGTGKDEKYLKELTAFYQLEHKVIFAGHAPDVKQIWLDHHVLLMPSTIEGMPLALIEGMTCGRPAVVSDVGGNTEIIDENVTGFIAEAPSPASFGKAMERMWEQKQRLREMGMEAAIRIKQKIDEESPSTLLRRILGD